jgi:hypothetical protein
MAKKVNLADPTFKVSFEFSYVHAPGLSDAVIGFLYFLLACAMVAGGIYTLYRLHRKGVIEVRIPKRCRVLCFKHYRSPEEKAEEARLLAVQKQIELQKELVIRMGYKPTVQGFDLDDPFFEEYEGGPRKKVKKHIKVKVERKPKEPKPPKPKKEGSSEESESDKVKSEEVEEEEGSLYETQSIMEEASEPAADFDIYDEGYDPNSGLRDKALKSMFVPDENIIENQSAMSNAMGSKDFAPNEDATRSEKQSNLEFDNDVKAASEIRTREVSDQGKSKKSSDKPSLKRKKTKARSLRKQAIPPADADERLTRKNIAFEKTLQTTG